MADDQLLTYARQEPATVDAVPIRPGEAPVIAYLGGLSVRSRRVMRDALAIVAAMLLGVDRADARDVAWQDVGPAETAAIRAKLIDRGYAPAYSNKILAAVRGVLKNAWRLNLMPGDRYARAVDIKPVPGSRVVAGREATADELGRIFHSCDTDPRRVRGLRDSCIFALAYGAALRRVEVAGVDLEQYDHATRTLRVIGKGDKERLVPVAPWVADRIQRWVAVRGSAPGPLVTRLGSSPVAGRLSDQAIYAAVKSRATRAGVVGISPHDFRRTLASELLERSNDLVAVQNILGHASPKTTEKYLRRVEHQKRTAAALLPDPRKD